MELEYLSTEYMLFLKGFSSLRKLEIKKSVLNEFPNLPEYLRHLKISLISDLSKLDSDHGILLPSRIRSLSLHGNRRYLTLPVIRNIDELHNLNHVASRISPEEFNDECDELLYDMVDFVTRKFIQTFNTCTIDELQRFLSQLTSDLKSLSIFMHGYIQTELNKCSICSLDKLSLEHFTDLEHLEFYPFIDYDGAPFSFDVSVFPAARYVKFTAPQTLTGCFTDGIRFLDIDLGSCDESLRHFLNHFISKLTTLVFLSISLARFQSADLRSVLLPHQLSKLEIKFCHPRFQRFPDVDPIKASFGSVILDYFPRQLNILKLDLFNKVNIVVDDRKGANIYFIAERISIASGGASWCQYSHFDCDEETFGIESLYM
ncbi:unnamed protein product [Ambrosiozyma monospora]|uniref:Unnamed protein product n=1 Tax=Ambrosiozyma monospora TaxID=43982 RepID=A0ACB5SQW2_AMBMO|nr:unnamed protein product [Ambrosiozyma monospora]